MCCWSTQFSQLFFVDLLLGGPSAPPVPVIVDLGAGLSMVNWLAAKQVGEARSRNTTTVCHRSVPAIVDLGAGLSMVNWLAAKQVGEARGSNTSTSLLPPCPSVLMGGGRQYISHLLLHADGSRNPVHIHSTRSQPMNMTASRQVGVSPSSPGLIRDAMKVWGIDGSKYHGRLRL